jgi:hypothetical protein
MLPEIVVVALFPPLVPVKKIEIRRFGAVHAPADEL